MEEDLRNRKPAAPPASTGWYLLAIVLLGAGLRLYKLAAYSLWYDETAGLYRSRFVDMAGSLFIGANSDEAPLLAVVLRFWYGAIRWLTGLSPTSYWSDFLLRLLPCLLGIAAIPLVYVVARRILANRRGALFAALLYAISPFQVYYAQELRVYAIYVPLALLALLFMELALERDRAGYCLGMILCFTALIYGHFASSFYILACNVYFVVTLKKRWPLLWKWFCWNLLMMVLIAPALYLAIRMQREVMGIEYPWYPNPGFDTLLITFKAFFAGYTPRVTGAVPIFWSHGLPLISAGHGREVFFQIIPWILGGLCLLGLVSLRQRWMSAALLAIVAVLPMALLGLLWHKSHFSFYEHRLFIFSGVLCAMAAGQGIAFIRWRWMRVTLLLAVAVFSAFCLKDYYQQRFHPDTMHRLGVWHKADFRSLVRYIEAHWQEGDLVAHTSHFTVYSFHHYFGGPHVRLGATEEDATEFIKGFGHEKMLVNHGLLPQPMREATEGCKRVWLVDSYGLSFTSPERTVPIRAWFEKTWHRAGEEYFEGLSVTLYTREAPPSQDAEGDREKQKTTEHEHG